MPVRLVLADDHLVLRLVGDDLVQQRQERGAAAVHNGASADLDHVRVGQNGGNLRLGSGQEVLVNQRFPHQARRHMSGAGSIQAHFAPPSR